MKNILANAELLALGLNITMTVAFLAQKDWPKVVYWLGATLVVAGVLSMRSV